MRTELVEVSRRARSGARQYHAHEIPFVAVPGDKLTCLKSGVFIHSGIYMPGNLVFNNSPATNECLAPLEAFSGGELITVMPQPDHMRRRAVGRAYVMLRNPRAYNVFTNNCEDSVNKALTGKPGSPQRKAWGVAVGVALFAVLASGEKPRLR